MPVLDNLRDLVATAQDPQNRDLSERDTERLLVDPFIGALGYNTRDRSEVETQPGIQVGSTKVKCDYAIKINGAPAILIECKKTSVRLGSPDQLSTYFAAEHAVSLGVYTNGLEYRFYSESTVGRLKRMDTEPFLLLDLLNFDDGVAEQVATFAKDRFDQDEVQELARRIRDEQAIKNALLAELSTPSDDLVRLLMGKVRAGSDQLDHYRPIVHGVVGQLGLSLTAPDRTQGLASSASPPAANALNRQSTPPASDGDSQGIPIRSTIPGQRNQYYHGRLLEGGQGRVRLSEGSEFDNPSAARRHLVPKVPKRYPNGWTRWKYFDQQDQRHQPIDRLRGLSDEEQIQRAGISIGFAKPAQPRRRRP